MAARDFETAALQVLRRHQGRARRRRAARGVRGRRDGARPRRDGASGDPRRARPRSRSRRPARGARRPARPRRAGRRRADRLARGVPSGPVGSPSRARSSRPSASWPPGRDYAYSAAAHFTLRYDGALDQDLVAALTDFLEDRFRELTRDLPARALAVDHGAALPPAGVSRRHAGGKRSRRAVRREDPRADGRAQEARSRRQARAGPRADPRDRRSRRRAGIVRGGSTRGWPKWPSRGRCGAPI